MYIVAWKANKEKVLGSTLIRLSASFHEQLEHRAIDHTANRRITIVKERAAAFELTSYLCKCSAS